MPVVRRNFACEQREYVRYGIILLPPEHISLLPRTFKIKSGDLVALAMANPNVELELTVAPGLYARRPHNNSVSNSF